MSDVVISGYYGFRNNGDDTLLMSIVSELRAKKPDIDIVVLSKNPEETQRIYNVRSVSRENVVSIIKEIKDTTLLISGGGTLIQDGTSTKSLLYYLFIIKMAQLFGKKVMLFANGIGPLGSKYNRKLTKKILNKTDIITLRDKLSQDELLDIGITEPNIYLTADPVFSLGDCGEDADSVMAENNIPNDKPLLLVSVRPWKMLRDDFCDVLAKACDYAAEKYGLYPVLLPMQLSRDTALSAKIRAKMRFPSTVIRKENDVKKLLAIYKSTGLCIGMRLHTLIYSAVSCVPMVGLVYDPKVSGFLDYIGVDNCIEAEEVTLEYMKTAIDRALSEPDVEKIKLAERRETLCRKAQLNTELAIGLLSEGERE